LRIGNGSDAEEEKYANRYSPEERKRHRRPR